MNGNPPLNKRLRDLSRRQPHPQTATTANKINIGSWQLAESVEGDLIAVNTETGAVETLALKL